MRPDRYRVRLVTVALAVGACTATPRPFPSASTTAPTTAREEALRAADFANRDYGFFTLRDGKAELREYEEMGGAHDSTSWKLVKVIYADVTADGVPEALVWIRIDSWTTGGVFHAGSELAVFAASDDGRDVDALGTINSPAIPIADVVVEGTEIRLTMGASDGACVERWRVVDGEVRPVGEDRCEKVSAP